ncbi:MULTISPECIES: phage terminase large subunit family protein [Photorhabdus]|uniref:phage terminase large subunit family protein n=1 Tax=Photorhabdus TaxID=29487 RepID=UPI000DCE38B2|nr:MULTISPECIES: terminase gpA endonuclease subunit [Photorhabdus]MCT8345433.1 phage terminase large subunit family protein [Photorhabdus kleinii]RAW91951.1 terminase [Photorhabdus sp. S9-53]RAW92455.1 terminase [Photorhabdus sp. S10-54]RAW95552.1 terminase [Photorhabdus sp. S8-52]
MSTNTSLASASLNLTQTKHDRLCSAVRRGWTPPPRISVPDWADQYRKLAKEAGSTSGNWETGTVEIARGPMLAATESGVHIITVMCCTQLMKTALLENLFGYFAHLDPCPILLLQPKEDAAEQFSKERITPLVRVTPILRKLVGGNKQKNSKETLLYKSFTGGFLALAGAGSPDNLARRPIRVLLADEVDKYPITREGDPITLAEERTATFGLNWLSVRACSPTVEDESRIAASYEDSDQRRASVACPHCEHRQFLDFFKHVHWPKEGDKHITRSAMIHCESCGAGWSEGERLRALKTIRWHQTKPFDCCGSRHAPLTAYEQAWRNQDDADSINQVWEWSCSERHAVYRAICPECGKQGIDNIHAGYQASKLFSPWQKDKPSDIAEKYLRAKGDPDKELAWWNTQMGLPHRPNYGKKLPVDVLLSRREVFGAEVPDDIAVLTAGIDTQNDRLEIEVVGWGKDEESWSIAYDVIEGDLETAEPWLRLDAYLTQIWRRADGRGFTIMAACMDSGGSHTQKVYEFAKERLGRRVWAIKGESAQMGRRSPIWPTKKPTPRTKSSFRPIIIGVNSAKDSVRSRLHIEKPGPGYMHFSTDRDLGYFTQLTAERLVMKESAGQRYSVWELPSGRANEALDCRVYAYAALCGLFHIGLKLNKLVTIIATDPGRRLLPPPVEPEEKINLQYPGVIIQEPEKPKRKRMSQLLPS